MKWERLRRGRCVNCHHQDELDACSRCRICWRKKQRGKVDAPAPVGYNENEGNPEITFVEWRYFREKEGA